MRIQSIGQHLNQGALYLAAVLALFLLNGALDASPAMAEEETVGEAVTDDGAGDYVLDVTKVTATKTGETDLQETPISITAFDSDFLLDTQSFRLADISLYTPNTSFASQAGVVVGFIRGIGSVNTGAGGEASVAMYVDGVYSERMLNASFDFLDVERIEVLRGPQGTLYGRNATGGAFNIITKRPTDELEVLTRIETGSFGKFRVDATAAGAVVENRLRGRITVVRNVRSGYVENLVGENPYNEEYTSLRSAIEILPTDNIDVLLLGDFTEAADVLGTPGKNITPNGVAGSWPENPYTPPAEFWDAKFDWIGEPPESLKNYGGSGTVTLSLPKGLALKSITAYREWNGTALLDADGTDLLLFHDILTTDMKQFSQEIQLSGTHAGLSWLAGFFYYKMDDNAIYNYDLTYSLGQEFIMNLDAKVSTEAYAGYVNATYNISPRLGVSAGIRYSFEEKGVDSITTFSAFGNDRRDVDKRDWDDWSPSFSVNYRASEQVFLFGVISKGFKSGTFVPWNNLDVGINLEPEIVWNFEIGAKTDWFGQRLRANVAAFYMDYKDIQVQTIIAPVPTFENAAKARIIGTELELLARPLSSALLFNSTLSYLNTRYDDFLTQDAWGTPMDASGNQFSYIPEWKVTFGAQDTYQMWSLGFVTLRMDLAWTDTVFFDVLEDDALSQRPVAILNALVKWESPDGRWRLELFGKNLTDEETVSNKQYIMTNSAVVPTTPENGDIVAILNPPRTFGIAFQWRIWP